MLASSWIAKGLVRPIWQRLDVKTYKRERLAELTGIPATNLSALNTGRLPMTLETATRIANAVEGVTVLDLGAPVEEAADDPRSQGLLDRLRRVEEEADVWREVLLEALALLGLRADLEADQGARVQRAAARRTRA